MPSLVVSSSCGFRSSFLRSFLSDALDDTGIASGGGEGDLAAAQNYIPRGETDGRTRGTDPFAAARGGDGVASVASAVCSRPPPLRDVNLTSILRKWLWANAAATTSYMACHLTYLHTHTHARTHSFDGSVACGRSCRLPILFPITNKLAKMHLQLPLQL